MHDMSKDSSEAPRYSKPVLTEHGQVTQFTHGSAGSNGDGPNSKRTN